MADRVAGVTVGRRSRGAAAPACRRQRVQPLRDLAEAIEAIAADCLLIVGLEDLHWSDQSTLDLVATWRGAVIRRAFC